MSRFHVYVCLFTETYSKTHKNDVEEGMVCKKITKKNQN